MNFFKTYTWIKVFSLLLLLIGSILYTYFDGYYKNIKNEKKLEIQKFNELEIDILKKYLLTARGDILFIKSLLEKFKQSNLHSSDEYLSLFKLASKELMIKREKYSQIRYLDVNGQEKIRLDFKDGVASYLEDEKLQNKKDRYYFKESLELKANEIYVSKFDLNMENSKIEIPYKPMIRFSTPVKDRNDNIFGYIIVNYNGTALLNDLKKHHNEIGTLLLNKKSEYLLGFDKKDEWSFMFDKEISLKKHHSKLWDEVMSQDHVLLKHKDKLYSSIKFDPVEIMSPNRSIKSKRLWYIVTYIDKDVVTKKFIDYLKSVAHLLMILVLILAAISSLVSLYLRKVYEEKIKTEISEAAFQNAEEGIFVVDTDAKIIHINSAFTKITGYSFAEVYMKNPKILKSVKGTAVNDYKTMWNDLLTKGHWRGIFINKTKEGRYFYAKNSISTVKRDGKILYYISVFSDVTKEKEQNEKLEKTTEDLASSLEELKNAQEKIVKTEKLSALGQLIAGISHEINSPLGAIKTSSNNVLNNITYVIKDIPKVESMLEEKQREIFDSIKDNLPLEQSLLSVKEQRALKKELKTQLDIMGIDDSRYISDKLANFNITNISTYEELLRHKEIKFIIDTLFKEFVTVSNIHTITRSVDRASKTIFALKKFAHFDHENSVVCEKIEDSINNILVLFSHNLKQGIEVQKEFTDLQAIYCYPDELAQVWMNLISNSIHAMNNQGLITIRTYEDNSHQVVSISDTGPGIPKEIQEKIFEPFYTTKPAGEGSGLGLDIVKKIIEGHKGKIELDSNENGTTFKIYISKNINYIGGEI